MTLKLVPGRSGMAMGDRQGGSRGGQRRSAQAAVTSSDPWFRPVQIKVGPDGAIYVADFHEQRIDHASHYQGRVTPDTGRIYRLRAPEAGVSPPFDYGRLSSDGLTKLLEHENKWHRQIALRLLADRRDSSILPALSTTLTENTGSQ